MSATTTMPTTILESAAAVASPQNGREARNLAEKHRRDKLNASIQELATMVPHVADSTRRMDKTAVLRFAAHGLRLQYVFGKTAKAHTNVDQAAEPNVDAEQSMQLTDTLMQLLDSFFVTLTCHGQIVLISSSVETLLGHCQSDLYGQNILHIVHPEDQALLLQQLIPRNMEALFRNESDDIDDDDDDDDVEADEVAMDALNNEEMFELAPSLHSLRYGNKQRRQKHQRQQKQQQSTHFSDIDKNLREDRRSFTVRLARAGTRSETTRKYEICMIEGLFRRSDYSASAGNFPIVSQLIRRSRTSSSNNAPNMPNWMQHDVAIAQAALHGVSGNDIVFVAMARVIRPPKVISRLMEANNLEYRTRHLIDGRIIDCDQRIGLVAGYMKEEVRNLCPFTFMHQDDVRWVIVALRQMYDCNSDYGESCYRLLSRNGHFIYLQTKGYLEIDKTTNKVHSFVCVNTLLDEEEGRRKVQEMKNKFSIIIKAKVPNNSIEDVPASQNPQQLERIVLYLIENLQKRAQNDNTTAAITTATLEAGGVYGALSVNDSTTKTATAARQRQNGSNKTTTLSDDYMPLALVPPEPDSVRNSISKSVNVVNVTAARNLHYNLRSPASYQSSEISLSPASSIDHADDLYVEHMTANLHVISPPPQHQQTLTTQRPSVLVQPNKLLPPMLSSQLQPNNAMSTSSSSPPKRNGAVSVLKRLPPPATNESVSPAKRTATSTATSTAAATAADNTFGDSLIMDANLQQLQDCSLQTTLSEEEYLSALLLDNVQNKVADNIKAEFIDEP